MDSAIKREKEIKKWNRQKKEALINHINPQWEVLATEKGCKIASFSKEIKNIVNELQMKK